jgi:hypothetical protein
VTHIINMTDLAQSETAYEFEGHHYGDTSVSFIVINTRDHKNLGVQLLHPAGAGRGRAAGGSKGLRGCQRSRIDVAVHLK